MEHLQWINKSKIVENKIKYIHSLVTDNKLSSSKMIDLLSTNVYSVEKLTELLFKLLVKQPKKHLVVRVSADTPFAKHVIEKKKRSTTMFNLLTYKGNPGGIEDYIIKLYNDDYEDTRLIVNHIDDLVGDDKIPYLKLFLENLTVFLNIGELTFTKIKKLFESYQYMLNVLERIKKEFGYIKLIGGETYAEIGKYDILKELVDIDYDKINDADIAIDLGGGYMTPDVSRIFNRELICLDKNDPKVGDSIKEYCGFTTEYIEKLEKQEWWNIDLIYDKIDDSYDKYFFSSFGFINSTIGPRDYLKNKYSEVSNYLISYMATYRLAELIVKKKEIYCIFLGRPTSRVNENKLLSLFFKDGKLIENEILSDPYSNKYCDTSLFGSRRTVVFV